MTKSDKETVCSLCGHPFHKHPYSLYPESSLCDVEKYPDEVEPERCKCTAGVTDPFRALRPPTRVQIWE